MSSRCPKVPPVLQEINILLLGTQRYSTKFPPSGLEIFSRQKTDKKRVLKKLIHKLPLFKPSLPITLAG